MIRRGYWLGLFEVLFEIRKIAGSVYLWGPPRKARGECYDFK